MHRDASDWTRRRATDEIVRAAHRLSDRTSFYRETAAAIRRVVPYWGACWITFDPASLLFTSHFTDELPADGFPMLCRNEYLDDDFNKFSLLSAGGANVGLLSAATGGNLETSARYRSLLAPFGLAHELRVAFVAAERAWGGLILLRQATDPDFSDSDVSFMQSISDVVAHGMRTAVATSEVTMISSEQAPGLLLLRPDGVAEVSTASATHWVEAIRGDEPRATGPLPAAILAVAARAQDAARAEDSAGSHGAVARSRVRTRSGEWLVLHGSIVQTPMGERTSIIIERARPSEIAPLVAEAYGLSDREREIAGAVLRGLSTAEIAGELRLSAYTVQDHLKAIFDKVGVRSRRDLVAQVFFQQYQPRIERHAAIGTDGWFADDAPVHGGRRHVE